MKRPMSRWTAGLFALVTITPVATMLADEPRTGSHLEGGTARPTAIYINEPSALDEVLKLIQSERNQEAVARARKHVEDLRSTQVVEETLEPDVLYSALNALCVALMAAGQTDEALATCSEAIDLVPRRWSAWNSRGTTYYADFAFDAALADFQRALALAPRDKDLVETLQLNVRLAYERLGDD